MKGKSVIIICLLLAFVTSLNAQTFKIEGVKYNVYGDGKVEVKGSSKKVLSIPSTVTYNGKVYTVERIGHCAFGNSKLEQIELPTTLKSIADWAFINTLNLKNIRIPEGVEVIWSSAFAGSGLEQIELPTTLKSIGSCAFEKTQNLKNIKIPEEIEVIELGAFHYSGLEHIELPMTVTKVEAFAFADTRLEHIELPASLKEIGENAFYWTKYLKSIKIPEGVEIIGDGAFHNSGLEMVFLPSSLKQLGKSCFQDCLNLKRLVGFHQGLQNVSCFKGTCLGYVSDKVFSTPQGFEVHIKDRVVSYALPSISDFLKSKIEPEINMWQKKGEFESAVKWKERVNENTRKTKIRELTVKYGEEYANLVKEYYVLNVEETGASGLNLSVYDPDNESFMITGLPDADILLSVKTEDAPDFKQNWDTIKKTVSLKYVPTGNGIALASVTFLNGEKKYTYDGKTDVKYGVTDVEYNFKPLDFTDGGNINNDFASLENSGETEQTISQGKAKVERKKVSAGTVPDVDRAIPSAAQPSNGNTFAVIIGNENYQKASKVEFANNDAAVFAQYCQKTLGLPEKNIRFYIDATYATMLSAVDDIQGIAKAFNGDVNIVFYYAGHGVPNESSNDAYLLPIDTDGRNTEVCYSLARLYKELGDMNVKSVTVFMDACFSGAQRGDGMLTAARGVAIKAKPATPQGNMVVFSAASGDETAYPYKEKVHGLFTYYLLKKLQETKGDVTLGELGRYIVDNVTKESVVSNGKSQTPTVVPSDNVVNGWENMKLR